MPDSNEIPINRRHPSYGWKSVTPKYPVYEIPTRRGPVTLKQDWEDRFTLQGDLKHEGSVRQVAGTLRLIEGELVVQNFQCAAKDQNRWSNSVPHTLYKAVIDGIQKWSLKNNWPGLLLAGQLQFAIAAVQTAQAGLDALKKCFDRQTNDLIAAQDHLSSIVQQLEKAEEQPVYELFSEAAQDTDTLKAKTYEEAVEEALALAGLEIRRIKESGE